MRHALGWSDLREKRVGIYGAGMEGASALERLTSLTDQIVVVDDQPKGQLKGFDVVAIDEGGYEELTRCAVVLKSPGVSRYGASIRALEALDIPLVGGTGLSIHDLGAERVIAITGTKGKSTTTSIVGHLLRQLGVDVVLAGNIGLPLFDRSVPHDAEIYVVETSSFQALDIADAPRIVGVTSLGVDHVDWHQSSENYQRDKLSLTSLPGAGITVAQGRDHELRRNGDLLGGEVQWVDELAGSWAEPLGLVGEHNAANAAMARAILRAWDAERFGDDELLREAAQGFTPLPGRLSSLATIEGVHFIDDSLATNVLPTLAALEALKGERLAIMIGGFDRGVDYELLVDALAQRRAPTLVLGLPESGHRLTEEISTRTETTDVVNVDDVASGVEQGFQWASPQGTVLLSPAAASFSQFMNWKERSDEFRRCVDLLSP